MGEDRVKNPGLQEGGTVPHFLVCFNALLPRRSVLERKGTTYPGQQAIRSEMFAGERRRHSLLAICNSRQRCRPLLLDYESNCKNRTSRQPVGFVWTLTY